MENEEAVEEVVETEEAEVGSSEDVKASIDPDILQNIPVTISVEVGRTSLKIKDLMRLTQGSVVELERLAGEPLDLFVNSTLVAQGEVVLNRYGLESFEGNIKELKDYIMETLRTGSAQQIRENIKYLNEKRQKPTRNVIKLNKFKKLY